MKDFCVFIPAFNAAKTIVSTLDSIDVSSKHIGDSVDIYVCDDCSKDNTVAVVNQYSGTNVRITLNVNDVNLGERATINKYWTELADNYKWTLLIHADDIPKENWIEVLYSQISSCDYSKVFTIWSSFDSFNDGGGIRHQGDNSGDVVMNHRTVEDARFYLAKVTSSFHVSGAAFNLALFSKIGGFDASMPQYGDTDYFARGMLAGFHDIYVKKTLTNYRVIATSVSFVSKKSSRDIKEMFYILKKYENVLTSKDKRRVLKLAIKYASKRCGKNILSLNGPLFLSNFKLLSKSIVGFGLNLN